MRFKLSIKETLSKLLAQEDTDGDKKITKEDKGPKSFSIQDENGKSYDVKGTYFLSNLMQELVIQQREGKEEANILISHIEEPPSQRISRMIKDYFWDDLTRKIDKNGLAKIVGDEKSEDQTQRIYVPSTDEAAITYYNKLQLENKQLEVVTLPSPITPEYVRSINTKPGILSLKLENGKGVPFVVPGGRFNEMYGWDSYFEGVGLLLDNRIDLAKAMVDNFCYQITHYGKILNANRTYYLTRTQPPFLSSFIREVYEADQSVGLDWLKETLLVAIKEYETVWMEDGKRLCDNGLNRYLAEGIGIPPETEAGHFDEVLSEYAKKHGLSLKEFESKYANRELVNEKLDEYFVHDRSVRENGHDTTWRLDNVCADLNTVDLNSLLYKYEKDFEYLIKTYFNDRLGEYNSAYWNEKANRRKFLVIKLLWNEDDGVFYDYNFKTKRQTQFESASNYFPLWAGLCDGQQATVLVRSLMNNLKEKGGVAGTSKKMDETIAAGKHQRQWDYPNGWAPHQMLIWRGLKQHGYTKELQELVYRWLWMITRNAVDYNGTIPEKYDVVNCTHKVYAEYGNVGTEFEYITTSGFGWMNASYQYGLSLLSNGLRDELDRLKDPDKLF
ncbi:trehalase family glycosidase [Spongiivirga citrea]|uniref:Trehalase n=1 Tax=Spongiivirga citrea TaxID=1481457 RepID=A0A6M0CQ10_9FLAO|nr:trehalase family glycosidase [Spongiivirga citrea]NER18124.1 trehalase [Spongiivirga citrea]